MSEADARCVIEALRDGRVGYLAWRRACILPNGDFFWYVGTNLWRVLHVRPGRIGLFATYEGSNGISVAAKWLVGPAVLKPPAYWDDCLAKTKADDLWACLEGWMESCPK